MTLGYYFEQAAKGPVTAPRYLIELDLGETEVLTVSSGAAITIGDTEWEGGLVDGVSIGNTSASIRIANSNHRWTSKAMNGDFMLRSGRVFLAYAFAGDIPDYFPPEYIEFDENDYVKHADVIETQLMLEGYITAVDQVWPSLELTVSKDIEVRYPKTLVTAPAFPNVPEIGYSVLWNGYRITVQ